jgi:hypothetical protein
MTMACPEVAAYHIDPLCHCQCKIRQTQDKPLGASPDADPTLATRHSQAVARGLQALGVHQCLAKAAMGLSSPDQMPNACRGVRRKTLPGTTDAPHLDHTPEVW